MKYLSIQTFQCGISVSGAATFTGGATINLLALNGATTSSEASLFLGAHGTTEGGQLVLQKGTSQTYAVHLDNYSDQFRVLYGTNTSSAGIALAVSLSTRQLILPAYTSSSSFSGTAAGYLAFDASGNIITTAVPTSGVTSIIAGTGVTVSSGTGNVTVSIGQSVATSATPSFDQIFLTNNGNGTNVKLGDDAWIGDANVANAFRVMGQQNNANGYIIFGNSDTTALGRSGTGNLTYGGSTVWTAATLTNLSQLTNDPGYITSAALAGYVPTSRTLSINGTSYDLSANRSWTISTVDYTSRLQHQVKAGVAINKGQAVYVTSADGTNMIVGLASNASETTSSKTMGLLDATVSTNGFANVVTEGLLAGLDTSTAGAEGDPVWLGTGGNLIYGLANKPYAPAHLVFIGIVTRKNNNNGEIFVKVQNGFELNEIHDVDLKTNVPVNGELLGFNGTLWVNKTIAGWLGYTPANASGTTNYLSKFTGSTTLGNSLIYDNGTNVGIGTASPSYKLDVAGSARVASADGLTIQSFNSNTGLRLDYGNASGQISTINLIANGITNGYIGIQMVDSSNGDLWLGSSGGRAMTVYRNGNVGIGTTNPSGQLSGTKGLSIVDGTNAALGLSNGTNNWLNYLSGTTYRIWNNTSNEVVTILLNGNVGIGTTSPNAKFDVRGTAEFRGSYSGVTIAPTATGADMYFYEASVPKIYIQSNDIIAFNNGYNFGIGTVTPSDELTVNSTGNSTGIAIQRSGTTKGLLEIGSSSDTFAISATSATGLLAFNTNSNERMRITSDGNVGIGTVSPSHKLTVSRATEAAAYQININNDGGISNGNFTGIRFSQDSNGTTELGNIKLHYYTTGATDLSFSTRYDTQAIYIQNGGNVGIGNTSPSYKLDVATGADGGVMRLLGTTGNQTYFGLDSIGGYIETNGTSTGRQKLRIQSYNGSAYTQLFIDGGNQYIYTSSNVDVGIGTSSPAEKLHVYNGNILIEDGYSLRSGSSYGASLIGRAVGASSAISIGSGQVGDYLRFLAGASERMRIDASGDVGIGTTSPAGKLNVVGGVNISRDGAAGTPVGQLGIYANPGTGVTTNAISFQYSGNALTTIASYNAGSYYQDFIISTSNGVSSPSLAEVLRIKGQTGNVGIGTSSPSGKLQIADDGPNALVIGSTQTSTIGETNDGGYPGMKIVPYNSNIHIGISSTNDNKISLWYAGNNYTYWQQLSTYSILSNYSTNALALQVNGGNVGIGTVSPNEKLHVAGNIHAYVAGGIDAGLYASTSGGSTTIAVRSSGVTYFNGGNVGVGTTSPVEKLHLVGNLRVQTTTPADSAGVATIQLNPEAGTPAYIQAISNFGPTSPTVYSAGLKFTVSNRDASLPNPYYTIDALSILANGNVGIGTTSPAEKLVIAGAGNVATQVEHTNVGWFRIKNTSTGNYWHMEHDYGDNDLRFGTSVSNGMLTLLSNGNVGIGTTSPGGKLEINGDNNILLAVSKTADTSLPTKTIASFIGIYNNGVNGHQLYVNSTGELGPWEFNMTKTWGGILTFGVSGDGTARTRALTINSSGNVGIGTTSPGDYKLYVSGGQYGTLLRGGDLGTGSDVVRMLKADNSVAMLVRGDGNVGIGTSSPQSKLHIETSASNPFRMVRGSTNFGFEIGGGAIGLYDYEDSIYRWYVDSVGNIGIGTTSPAVKLHVVGSSILANSTNINPDSYSGSVIAGAIGTVGGWGLTSAVGGNSGTGHSWAIGSNGDNLYMGYENGSSSNSMQTFLQVDDSTRNVFLVPSSGNVGIGTTSPAAKLHVAGNQYTTGDILLGSSGAYNKLRFYRYEGSAVGGMGWDSTDSCFYIGGIPDWGPTAGNNVRVYGFGQDLRLGNAIVGDVMTINTSANVGIGTTNPTSKVSISDGVSMYSTKTGVMLDIKRNVTNGNDTTSRTGIRLGNNSNAFDIYYGGTSDRLRFVDGGDTEVMSLVNGGNVGIGTSSPTGQLTVQKQYSSYAPGEYLFKLRAGNGATYDILDAYYEGDAGIFRVGYAGLNYSRAVINGGTGAASASLSLFYQTSSNVYITANGTSYFNGGNVGIGITAPTEKLHVNGDTRIVGNTYVGGIINAYQGDASIWVPNLGQAFTVKQTTGNVGIGTSSPSEKLHVTGASIFDGGSGDSSTDAVVYVTKSNNNDWGLYVNAAGLDYGMYTRVSPSAGYAFAIHNGTTWTTRITGNAVIYLGEKNAIDGNYDSWLRLNNQGHYTSGVYTPYVFRNDGEFINYGGIYGYNTIRARKAQTAGSYTTAALWTESYDATATGIAFHISGIKGTFLEMRTDTILYWDGYQVIHGGNIGSQSVSYANSAGAASSANEAFNLLREDNRTISPSELSAGYLKFGFTSWTNNNNAPYADYLHLRSYTDASGGLDNLVMFKKSGMGMRIWQQTWGSSTPYSSYVDVWTTGDFTSSSVSNWNTAYGWGNHASAGYATTSYVTTQINNLVNGAPGALDTLNELAAALGNDASFSTTVTNSIAAKLPLAGGTMTGDINWTQTDRGLTWGMNTDGAYIKFYNTGDGDTNSRLEYATSDNGDEYHRWVIAGTEKMNLKWAGLTINGTISATGYNNSNWDTAYSWGNHASAGYALNSALANYLPLTGGSIGGALTINGNLTVNGTITENSSLKLKENIKESEGNLDKVLNLRPVHYNKIGSQTTELGLIAEEVSEVYPEFVQYDENGDPVGVHYSRLTAALIGAVKELTKRIETLENNG